MSARRPNGETDGPNAEGAAGADGQAVQPGPAGRVPAGGHTGRGTGSAQPTGGGGLLEQVNGPEDLKRLSEEELAQLAQEVREHIIDTVGEIGGHFGANLGTCELAVALHTARGTDGYETVWFYQRLSAACAKHQR